MKTTNEYAGLIDDIYDRTPKAVFAALAVSLANQCDPDGADTMFSTELPSARAEALILREWQALYDAGVVPQKPISPCGKALMIWNEIGDATAIFDRSAT